MMSGYCDAPVGKLTPRIEGLMQQETLVLDQVN
jgi:hypothetical protein